MLATKMLPGPGLVRSSLGFLATNNPRKRCHDDHRKCPPCAPNCPGLGYLGLKKVTVSIPFDIVNIYDTIWQNCSHPCSLHRLSCFMLLFHQPHHIHIARCCLIFRVVDTCTPYACTHGPPFYHFSSFFRTQSKPYIYTRFETPKTLRCMSFSFYFPPQVESTDKAASCHFAKKIDAAEKSKTSTVSGLTLTTPICEHLYSTLPYSVIQYFTIRYYTVCTLFKHALYTLPKTIPTFSTGLPFSPSPPAGL